MPMPPVMPECIPTLDLAAADSSELRHLLRTHVPDRQVWAYGSRVTGRAHPGSDLDLVLRDPHDLSRRSAGLGDLREALQRSRLPMLVDVHDWADLPASFHREIERIHVELMAGR